MGHHHKQWKGFTLLEMMLVMAIMATVMAMVLGFIQQRTQQLRDDKTTAQLQQVLNAGLAYYVVNGKWPDPLVLSTLTTGSTYLPSTFLNNFWSNPFVIGTAPAPTPPVIPAPPSSSVPALFYVYTRIGTATSTNQTNAEALIISGQLSMGFTATAPPASTTTMPTARTCVVGQPCYVVAAVNIPGQSLNTASAINFAGIYHPGACVPVPTCPIDPTGAAMTPQIIVVPLSMSGLNDYRSMNLYPINSFTAYALGGTSNNPPGCPNGAGGSPGPSGPDAPPCGNADANSYTGNSWRACAKIITPKGDVSTGNDWWAQSVYLWAFTRCSPNNEPKGSNLQVFTQ